MKKVLRGLGQLKSWDKNLMPWDTLDTVAALYLSMRRYRIVCRS